MFNKVFVNLTADTITNSFTVPRDGRIDLRFSGDVGSATVLLIAEHPSYGESIVDLELTNTLQAFPVNLFHDETFKFQVTGSDANTSLTLFYSY